MKAIAFSDIHGNLNDLDLQDAQLVLIAGDFAKMTGFGKWHLYDQKKWIAKKFFSWTSQHLEKEFVIVPGNHDLCLDPSKTQIYSDLDWKLDCPSNVHILANSSIDILGLKIYGTPNIPIISYCWAFESEHDKLLEAFSKIPGDLDILLTHTPPRLPFGYIDCSLQYGISEHFGSSELTEAIVSKSPKYVFCGHIHTGDHAMQNFENSKIFNVSRLNEDYNIAFEPLVLDI